MNTADPRSADLRPVNPRPADPAPLFSLDSMITNPLARGVLKTVGKPLAKVLALDALAFNFKRLPGDAHGLDYLRAVKGAFGFSCQVEQEDLDRIPASGPVVVVANHPYGGLEGVLLADMLCTLRPDVRIMANHLLGRVEQLRDIFILVDPFGTRASLARNIAPLRESVAWLRSGGVLGVFPAGEVAHFTVRERRVAEPRWSPSIVRLIRSSGATVVPVHFSGANGALFHLAGMVHPKLRTALLAREFVNKASTAVRVRVGQPVPAARLEELTDQQAADFLRLRTEVLGRAEAPCRATLRRFPLRGITRQEALAAPVAPALMAAEVAALPAQRLLVQAGTMHVYEARAREIPLVLREIGRLRELTFRKVGEGTGRALDLDAFDAHYAHVFIWNAQDNEVVGAYRLGRTDEILASRGPSGLYVSTLFKLKPRFLHELGPALEMGRSFVRPEHQKSYNALLLLWKGIGAVVARQPRYRRLFGPVSITNEYRAASRQLIAGFFEARREMPELSRLVRPRTPLKAKGWLARAARGLVADVESLSDLVSSLEADRKGIPVLLRQYLKLGGKLLAFNVDHGFSDALDGLIVVDLKHTERKQLERYLGKQGARDFLDHHAQMECRRSA